MTPIDTEILPVKKDEHDVVLEVWEASVRATHDFLTEEDIRSLRPQVPGCLDTVELSCIKEEGGRIVGFIGVAGDNIDMLFVDPSYRGRAVGKTLLQYAVQSRGARKVDVNEQNGQAVGFYKHMGFEVVRRSPLDGQGNPFPLLHMELS